MEKWFFKFNWLSCSRREKGLGALFLAKLYWISQWFNSWQLYLLSYCVLQTQYSSPSPMSVSINTLYYHAVNSDLWRSTQKFSFFVFLPLLQTLQTNMEIHFRGANIRPISLTLKSLSPSGLPDHLSRLDSPELFAEPPHPDILKAGVD